MQRRTFFICSKAVAVGADVITRRTGTWLRHASKARCAHQLPIDKTTARGYIEHVWQWGEKEKSDSKPEIYFISEDYFLNFGID
jgi:hypothetical protein